VKTSRSPSRERLPGLGRLSASPRTSEAPVARSGAPKAVAPQPTLAARGEARSVDAREGRAGVLRQGSGRLKPVQSSSRASSAASAHRNRVPHRARPTAAPRTSHPGRIRRRPTQLQSCYKPLLSHTPRRPLAAIHPPRAAQVGRKSGAGDGTRTRDIQLGNLARRVHIVSVSARSCPFLPVGRGRRCPFVPESARDFRRRCCNTSLDGPCEQATPGEPVRTAPAARAARPAPAPAPAAGR